MSAGVVRSRRRGGHGDHARELAVAITCAREQLVLVSSFEPEELASGADVTSRVAVATGGVSGVVFDSISGAISSGVPSSVASAGSAITELPALLAFARAGGGASRPVAAEDGAHADGKPASPITAAIARALGDRGWTVRHQVGCGGLRIDLAVVDPNDPERYVLAIEHDGPQ